MKIKILSKTKIDNAHVNITFQILKNDGTVLKQIDDRGFVSVASTVADARSEMIQSFKHIRDSLVNELQSKLDDAVTAAVGTEIDIA